MDLDLTEDQVLLVDTTRRFLADSGGIAHARQLAEHPAGLDAAWWQTGAGLGWSSLLAPAELGGGGVSDAPLLDVCLLAYERGRVAAAGPFAATNAAVIALRSAAGRSSAVDEALAGIVAGTTIATVAVDEERNPWTAARWATELAATGDGAFELRGDKRAVEHADVAQVAVVAAMRGDTPVLVLVHLDQPSIELRTAERVDLTRNYGDLHFDGTTVAADRIITDDPEVIAEALDAATLVQLAETVGVMDQAFDTTLEWAFDRHTFGRPLASYQEIKHRIADMKLQLEASKATVGAAAAQWSQASAAQRAELVSAAVSYVDAHAPELVQDCVQIHGGIGLTWEHDIHISLRRVTVNALTCGTVVDHRERLAAQLLEGAA